ncbi:MAG TPA: DISARM system phospholipase D-like protein DrmC [Terriglobia bacterium]|nr:DISARM system phospholipase D-like protein DrmC [Terriglobia bacterium]
MIEKLIGVPGNVRARLAAALETGMLTAPYSAPALRSVLGSSASIETIGSGLTELARLGITGPAAGVWLRTVETASARTPKPDLVWSGPEVPGVPARNTRQVFEELLGFCAESVWVSTYAYFDGPKAFEVLARRMDTRPAIRATLLLNIQRRKGDDTAADSLVRKFADRFWKTDWPGNVRPRVYYDPRALERDGPEGVLHAKAVVTDDENVFVTSANLTEAALDRNMELGLLYRDRALAASITSHLRGLIDLGVLKPLPMQ